MKSGFLDLLLETCGWVVGKTFLFYFGVAAGIGMALFSIWLSGCGLSANPAGGLWSLALWGAILLQFAGIFLTSLWWVRSEKTGVTSWGVIASIISILWVALYSGGGASIFSETAMWVLLACCIGGLFKGVRAFRQWQVARWAANAEQLEADNVERRVVLTERFGTVSTGARDLGLME
jgi:hypothetical protein